MEPSVADIKWALIELARAGKPANRTSAIRYIEELWAQEQEYDEGLHEAEMFAEFGSSWVHGGGSASDVSAAWAMHRDAYMRGDIG